MGVVLFRLDFGNTNSYGPGNALTLFEAFKIYGGQIHAVKAFMDIMPENTPSGWPRMKPPSPRPGDPAQGAASMESPFARELVSAQDI